MKNLLAFLYWLTFSHIGLSAEAANQPSKVHDEVRKEIIGMVEETTSNLYDYLGGKQAYMTTKVKCYSGHSFLPVVILYEYFPDWGFFRVRVDPDGDIGNLVYHKCAPISNKTEIKRLQSGNFELGKLRNRILTCASGIVGCDVTDAQMGCEKNKNYTMVRCTTDTTAKLAHSHAYTIRLIINNKESISCYSPQGSG